MLFLSSSSILLSHIFFFKSSSTFLQMKRKSLYSFISSSFDLLSMLTLLVFLSETVSSVDPHYEACEPRNCGNQRISYPFWMADVQEPYCGYPGFKITCQDHNPILHIPENDYLVHQILYENQSVRVSPAAFLHFESGCRFPPISNLSVQDNIFTIACNVSHLYVLSNCSSPLPPKLWDYKIRNCSSSGTEREDDLVLAMFKNDKNLNYALKECKRDVLAPVELHKGDDGEVGDYKYIDVLTRGFALNWRASNCSGCQASGGRCGFDLNNSYFKCFCPDRPHLIHCTHMRRRNYVKWILAGTGVLAAGIVIVVLLFRRCRRDTSNKSVIFWKTENMMNQNVEVILKKWGALAPKRYSYSDIKKMTCSFKEKLGQGGYGTVYKGNFKTGNLIAVKVLNKSRGNVEEFVNEVTSIGKTSHVNIVTLLGFCLEGKKRALVYEFMPNGSLEKFLHNENSPAECRLLGWETLYQIAIGIARGLEYLHCGCNTRILHLDIKPQNILLDEDFCPKISDFGLAKICPRKESIVSMSGMRGTAGYIAPEMFSRNFGGVSHKSDVYSYGMMLLNMVVGRENIDVRDHTSEQYFPDWIYRHLERGSEIGQHGIMNGEENEKARKMTIVGLWCIQINLSDRPAMSRVLDMLEGSLESLQIPPRPFFSSPQRTLADMSTNTLPLSSSTKF